MSDNTIDLEQNVLGGVMNQPAVLARCELSPADFTVTSHRHAWDAMQRLARQGIAIDALSVAEQLDTDRVDAPKEGWLPYLATVSRETVTPHNAPTYANALRARATLRAAQGLGREIAALDNLDILPSKIRELINLETGKRDYTCHLQTAMQLALDAMSDSSVFVTTGLRDLDDMLGGFRRADLIVVGARPACGKTAFAINCALAPRVPVGFISGEQGRDQIGMRALAINGSISLHRLRKGALHDSEWGRLTTCLNAAKDRQIWLYDRPAPTIDEVERQARAWRYEKKIELLLVDYLQKIRGGEGENKRLQVGDIASRLKNLARELDIAVVALAQVSRECERRDLGADGMGRMPYMPDLKESGDIEAEADQVLTLYRPEVYSDEPRFAGLAYVNCCKNRHGPVGHKAVTWRGEYLQFADLAHTEHDYDRNEWEAPR